MPHNRFYSPTLTPSVELSPEEQRHLRVMRVRAGDTLELVDGLGNLATATLTAPNCAEITALHSEPPPPQMILAQALPQRSRLDGIIEKSTELGATQFVLFPAERSETYRVDLERLRRIAIAAMKQCGTLYLPTIELRDALPLDLPQPAVFGAVNGPPLRPPVRSILIGPGSGLTEAEQARLQEAGIQPASWHRNTLRADTAGMAALAILSARS